jgi:hypothetical protein
MNMSTSLIDSGDATDWTLRVPEGQKLSSTIRINCAEHKHMNMVPQISTFLRP